MQNLSLRYTKWINSTRHRSGHLFQGRYKALLLDADSYLLELVRYVHLNPVRAGIVKTPFPAGEVDEPASKLGAFSCFPFDVFRFP